MTSEEAFLLRAGSIIRYHDTIYIIKSAYVVKDYYPERATEAHLKVVAMISDAYGVGVGFTLYLNSMWFSSVEILASPE